MSPPTSDGYRFTVALADEEAARRLMVDIAAALAPGDLVTLSGDLGAGKTTFARAMIRHFAGDPAVEVPSPTFTLLQAYELPRFTLVHADLYRLNDPAELAELGLEEILPRSLTLLEWPDRAEGFLPDDRLDVALNLSLKDGPYFRSACVTGYGTFAARAECIADIRASVAKARREGLAVGFVPIEYEHIRPQRSYRKSTVYVEAVNATPEYLVGRKLIAEGRPVSPERLADSAIPMKNIL